MQNRGVQGVRLDARFELAICPAPDVEFWRARVYLAVLHDSGKVRV